MAAVNPCELCRKRNTDRCNPSKCYPRRDYDKRHKQTKTKRRVALPKLS